MEKRLIIPAFALLAFALVAVGCNDNKELATSQQSRSIILSVSSPTGSVAASRAPVDSWDNTPVSVAYMFAPAVVFDRALTVSVTDNTGEHVNTGMEYPLDNSVVSFIGYHPVAAPNAVGTITYDISKGDVDVMMSNSVSGTLSNTIIGQGTKLVFEHMLTRITFKLQCAPGQSYPEPVFGMRASASGAKSLNTAVTLDLGAENLTFKISGGVFTGDLNGFVIPLFGAPAVIVDMMLQPDVPLAFDVVSLTGDRSITITGDPGGYWANLTAVGGERGKQYTVELAFSGEMILAQNITVTPWINGNQNLGGNSGTWW
ncbi:MAG: fimbrillin family protein [Rikenellaceae bacterium]|nr:fimbrillin family protein [Rikenellaceae bacterium]MCL2692680.1 fimbrillin family protein [Rikenellaceae bacterium]